MVEFPSPILKSTYAWLDVAFPSSRMRAEEVQGSQALQRTHSATPPRRDPALQATPALQIAPLICSNSLCFPTHTPGLTTPGYMPGMAHTPSSCAVETPMSPDLKQGDAEVPCLESKLVRRRNDPLPVGCQVTLLELQAGVDFLKKLCSRPGPGLDEYDSLLDAESLLEPFEFSWFHQSSHGAPTLDSFFLKSCSKNCTYIIPYMFDLLPLLALYVISQPFSPPRFTVVTACIVRPIL